MSLIFHSISKVSLSRRNDIKILREYLMKQPVDENPVLDILYSFASHINFLLPGNYIFLTLLQGRLYYKSSCWLRRQLVDKWKVERIFLEKNISPLGGGLC